MYLNLLKYLQYIESFLYSETIIGMQVFIQLQDLLQNMDFNLILHLTFSNNIQRYKFKKCFVMLCESNIRIKDHRYKNNLII